MPAAVEEKSDPNRGSEEVERFNDGSPVIRGFLM
jgi:hypothetical protein